MLDILKGIINYIPRESIEDMMNVRIMSIGMVETENQGLYWDFKEFSDESEMATSKLTVFENQAKEVNLDKSDDVEDIIRTILDKFEEDYKVGKNYNKVFNINESDANNLNRILSLLAAASNTIASNGRIGLGNVAIVPEKFKDSISSQYQAAVNQILFNPISDYDDRIFVIRIDNEIHQQKYHLLTDKRIPSKRELKLNKLLNKENDEINYVILPVQGHNESVVVINIV